MTPREKAIFDLIYNKLDPLPAISTLYTMSMDEYYVELAKLLAMKEDSIEQIKKEFKKDKGLSKYFN